MKIFRVISARFYRENEYNRLGVLSEPDNLNYHDRCENFLTKMSKISELRVASLKMYLFPW